MPGRGSARGRGGEWGAAGVRARSAERWPGRPASPAIATDAGVAGPPPSRPLGNSEERGGRPPSAGGRGGQSPLPSAVPGPRLLGSRAFHPVHDPNPQPPTLPAVPGPQLPGNSLPPGACPPTHPGAAHLSGPQLLGSVALLHPAHAHPQDACCPQIPTLHPMHGPPSAPAYATPRASLRRWQGAGVLPHCVSVGESLRLSELPPWRLLVLLKAAVSQRQREMDPPVAYQGHGCLPKTRAHSPARPCTEAAGCSGAGVGARPHSSPKNPALALQTGEQPSMHVNRPRRGPPAPSLAGPFQSSPGQLLGPPLLPLQAGAHQAGAASLPGADPRPIDPSPGLSRLAGRCSTFGVIC